jgi:hypothetical protein
MEVVLINFLESLEYFWNRPTWQVVYCCKAYVATQREKERDLINEENVFKEIYQYNLHRCFRITMVLADEEFASVKSLIDSMPGGQY